MNHQICVVLMFLSFAEAGLQVTPVEVLEITKYLGLWYEVS